LTLDTNDASPWAVFAESIAILILAISVLAVRYGHVHLPYTDEGD